MNNDEGAQSFRSRHQPNPNPPPMTSLPSIPQLPPITLATSPSVESFTTALSSTSTKESSRRPSAVDNIAPTLSFTPPASPSAGIYNSSSTTGGPSQPRTVRAVSSVQHFRHTRPTEPTGGTYETYFSDFSSDMENRGATPVPANYIRRTTTTSIAYASGSSDVEQRGGYTYAGIRRWESERDEPNPPSSSRAGPSRGGGSGTMSDSHTPSSTVIIRSKAISSASASAAQPFPSSAAASRLHALSNASSPGASGSFVGTNGRTPSSPTVRRDATPVPPIGNVHPPPGKPLPNPNATATSTSASGSRVMGRARSASLLGMVSTAAALNPPPPGKDLPRSSSTIQGFQKPRLTLRPATTTSPPVPEFTILVIGSSQCGKSVLISKGLKSWALEKERNVTLGTYTTTVQTPPSHSSISSSAPSSSGFATRTHEIRGIARIAHVAIKNQTYPIETLEISSHELMQAGAAWPAVIANGSWGSDKILSVADGVKSGVESLLIGTSHSGRIVDGLVVCYDSSDADSWTVAKKLLEDASHAYTSQPLQAIVVACKTDLLRPPVPTDHTQFHPLLSRQSLEADQYQIGMPDGVRSSGHRRNGSSDDGHGTTGDGDSGKQPVHKNLGLVPVARTEGVGKKKMRDSFNWLLRRVERAKRHHRIYMASQSPSVPAQTSQPPAPPHARTPTPTPPAQNVTPAEGPQTSFWPAPVSKSTPPTGYSSPPHPPAATTSSPPTVPLSPRSAAAFSSPGSAIAALQHQAQSPGSSIRSPRSPTSPTRARSTSDLAHDFARGEQKLREEMERDREFVAKGLGAKGSSAASASGRAPGTGDGSGTETRSSGSGLLPGRKTSASATNLRAQADNFARPGPVPPAPMPPNNKSGSVAGSIGKGSLAGSVKAALAATNGTNTGAEGPESRRGSNADGPGADPSRGQSITVSMLPMKAMKEPPPLQYATFDELLDKLVFLSVTDDDEIYIEQFLLVFRRFATPRTLLLGLQRRMRELSPPTEDTLLAKYAQMRICNLLEEWMKAFPGDFAAPGAEPALQALIRQTLLYPHTAHYGSDFTPFLNIIPDLVDEEGSWALQENRRRDDDGSSELGLEHDDDSPEAEAIQIAKRASVSLAVSLGAQARASADSLHQSHSKSATHATANASTTSLKTPQSNRAGTSNGTSPGPKGASSAKSARTQPSVPLFGEYNSSKGLRGPDVLPGTKPNMRELMKAAMALANQPPHYVAEEITRLEVPLFLAVQPRDWLRHGLGDKRRTEGFPDSIQRMAKFYNYLTLWTASMILVHDKARARAKSIEFFIRVAMVLRKLNNYSGLRAVVSGINTSRTDRDNDPVMAYVRDRHLWKKEFKSLETLLGTSRMHSAYRMALKHTFDAAIPSMEVHTYDLIRADDTNPDYKPGDETQIHWGKFSLIAKMVLNVVMYQDRFQDTTAFTFPERSEIRELLMNIIIMDEDTLYSRVSLPTESRSASSAALLSDASASASRFRQMFQRR